MLRLLARLKNQIRADVVPDKSCGHVKNYLMKRRGIPNDWLPLRIVGGQHRSLPHGEVLVLSAHLRKLQYHGSIEPAFFSFAEKNLQRFLRRESSPVRTMGSQCIVNVRDLQNSRFQRNGLSAKSIWIAAPIHFFMMMPYHRENAAKRLYWRAHFFSYDRMLPYHFRFFRVQRSGFKKDAFWHANLPYIVKPAREAEFLQVSFSKAEVFSQLFRVLHETIRVAIPH